MGKTREGVITDVRWRRGDTEIHISGWPVPWKWLDMANLAFCIGLEVSFDIPDDLAEQVKAAGSPLVKITVECVDERSKEG